MKDKPLLVAGCPLCDIFLDKKVRTKLYWPNSENDILDSEFIIIDCETCKIPMLVFKDHTPNISKETWGRILYRCRNVFGNNITLRTKARRIFDHFHCHIIIEDKYGK